MGPGLIDMIIMSTLPKRQNGHLEPIWNLTIN